MKKLLERVTEMMQPYPVYLVGGAVRDYLMGDQPKDFDFCTPANPDQIEEKIRAYRNKHGDNRKVYGVGKKFGTLGCRIGDKMIEVTTFRSEKYKQGDRKPDVEFVTNLDEDLGRRDFTINSMAIRFIKGNIKVIDPYNGQEDLKAGIIRAVGNPKQRFKEDPLRMLRAIRFASRYDYKIEEKTFEKMKKLAVNILDISKERWMSELDKILLCDNVDNALMFLWTSNLFKFMIPELHLQFGYDQNSKYHVFSLEHHTINVVAATPKDLDLRWAALLHDVAKPFVRTDKIVKDNYHESFEDIIKSNYIDHEILGAEMVRRIALHLNWSKDRTNTVVGLVREHLNDSCPLRQYDNIGKGK